MADFTDRIRLVIDTVTQGATRGVDDVKARVGEADGAFGKLKAGATGSLDAIGVTAGTVALGAAAAIGGFALKGVSDFTNLADAAKSFSTTAGISVEDASRWIETSDDLGVSVDAVQGAMQRVGREADAGKLDQFNLQAKNGTDRFIELLGKIEAIPDADARAAAAFQVFGRSYQSLAPLLANVGTLRQRLDSVSGAKIITDDQVRQARQFKDDIDNLTDDMDNLKLSAGEAILPLLDTLAKVAKPVADFVSTLEDAKRKTQEPGDGASWMDRAKSMFATSLPESIKFFLNKVDEGTGGTGHRFDDLKKKTADLGDVVETNGRKFLVMANQTKDVTDLTDDQVAALRSQDGALGDSAAATDKLAASQMDVEKALADATKAAEDQSKSFFTAADSQAALSQSARDYALGVHDLPGTLADIAKGHDDATTKAKNMADAYAGAAAKAKDLADKLVTYTADQATANGTTLNAKDKLDLWNASMISSASQAKGPLRDAIISYIATVNGIPATKVSEILATTPNLADAQKKIDDASKNRALTVSVYADTTNADQGIKRVVDNDGKRITIFVDAKPGQHTGGGSAIASMAGGHLEAGQPYIVGEVRPELFVPDRPGQLLPVVPDGAGAPANATNVTVINHWPASTPAAEVVRAIDHWTQTRGALVTSGAATGL